MYMKIGNKMIFNIKYEKMSKKSIFLNLTLKMTLSIIFMIRFVISAPTYSRAGPSGFRKFSSESLCDSILTHIRTCKNFRYKLSQRDMKEKKY